jgi:pilus assembly protein CpaB
MFIYTVIQDARNRVLPQRPEETLTVVVATKHIAPGWTITPEMLESRELLAAYVPGEAIKETESVVGRVAQERILAGEFIRDDRLAPPEAGIGMGAIIPRGMRAYQVAVKGGQGMSGFLSPGNFVDVIAVCVSVDPPETRSILRSISVLAVNDKMVDSSYEQAATSKKKSKTKPSVTLALTPSDAVLVKHAESQCELYLALRNDIDVTNVESNEAGRTNTTGETIGVEFDPAAQPAEAPPEGGVEPAQPSPSPSPG